MQLEAGLHFKYLSRQSPDTLENSYKAITGTISPPQGFGVNTHSQRLKYIPTIYLPYWSINGY